MPLRGIAPGSGFSGELAYLVRQGDGVHFPRGDYPLVLMAGRMHRASTEDTLALAAKLHIGEGRCLGPCDAAQEVSVAASSGPDGCRRGGGRGPPRHHRLAVSPSRAPRARGRQSRHSPRGAAATRSPGVRAWSSPRAANPSTADSCSAASPDRREARGGRIREPLRASGAAVRQAARGRSRRSRSSSCPPGSLPSWLSFAGTRRCRSL
jgi:hypothetical protein